MPTEQYTAVSLELLSQITCLRWQPRQTCSTDWTDHT